MIRTRICDLLGIPHPIVLGGMRSSSVEAASSLAARITDCHSTSHIIIIVRMRACSPTFWS